MRRFALFGRRHVLGLMLLTAAGALAAPPLLAIRCIAAQMRHLQRLSHRDFIHG
jgi:hypothetical protein